MAQVAADEEPATMRRRLDALNAELSVLRAAVDLRSRLLHEQSGARTPRDPPHAPKSYHHHPPPTGVGGGGRGGAPPRPPPPPPLGAPPPPPHARIAEMSSELDRRQTGDLPRQAVRRVRRVIGRVVRTGLRQT